MEPVAISLQDIYRVMMVTFRTGALIMTVPVFGHTSIPRMLRILLILILAVLLYPFSLFPDVPTPPTLPHLTLAILSELAVGFTLGFAVIAVFAAVQFAGHLVGTTMGLAAANVMDPLSAGQLSVIGEFYYLFSIIVFLTIDGHHAVIEALVQSFRDIPIGGAMFDGNLLAMVSGLSASVFVLAIKLAAPVLVTLFIINLVMGIIARTVPQMNVFVVGFPLAIAAGLILVREALPFFAGTLTEAFRVLGNDFGRILKLLSG